MWPILKAEFRYTWPGMAIGWVIALLLTALNMLSKEAALLQVMPPAAVTFLITAGILGSESDQEKRERFLSQLPVPPRWVFWSRILYLAAFLGSMAVIWALSLWVQPELQTAHAVWSIVAVGSLTMAVITLFVIHHDLGFVGSNGRHRWTLWLTVVGLEAALVAYGYLAGWKTLWGFLLLIFQTPIGSLSATAGWLLLTWLSLKVFLRRRSYLA